MKSGTLSFPISLPEDTRLTHRRISAIQLVVGEEGDKRLGAIVQIPKDARLETCGDGFNEHTVKVRWQGLSYFVFRDDLG